MAGFSIADASRVGKGVLDRAAIFRAAHASARHAIASNRAWRCYRQAFAQSLRTEWRQAKHAAAQAEVEAAAAIILPPDIAERVRLMRADAWLEPVTAAGNARMRAIYAEADEIEEAARLNMITAMDGSHHAAC